MPKAAVCAGIDQPLEVVEVDLESPKAGEVRVRMGASGVCHSDLSVVNGTLLSPLPSVLGHEGAGIVEEVGEGVTSVAPGDHVVLSFVPQCGHCYFCTHDAAEMCETGFIAMAMGSQLDMTPRFGRGRVAAPPDVGPRHVLRGARVPRDLDRQDRRRRAVHPGRAHRLRRAHRVRCRREHRGREARRHGRGHRLRWRRPQRDPGREVQGRGADHRGRPVRLEAEARRGVRRD